MGDLVLNPPTHLLSDKGQIPASTSKVSERGKRAAPHDNEDFIRDVFTDFCLEKTRTSDIQGYQGQADSEAFMRPPQQFRPQFHPDGNSSATSFPYNFVLLSQAIAASCPRYY